MVLNFSTLILLKISSLDFLKLYIPQHKLIRRLFLCTSFSCNLDKYWFLRIYSKSIQLRKVNGGWPIFCRLSICQMPKGHFYRSTKNFVKKRPSKKSRTRINQFKAIGVRKSDNFVRFNVIEKHEEEKTLRFPIKPKSVYFKHLYLIVIVLSFWTHLILSLIYRPADQQRDLNLLPVEHSYQLNRQI